MADNPIKKKKGGQVTRIGFRTQEKSMGYIIFTYVHMCQSFLFIYLFYSKIRILVFLKKIFKV